MATILIRKGQEKKEKRKNPLIKSNVKSSKNLSKENGIAGVT